MQSAEPASGTRSSHGRRRSALMTPPERELNQASPKMDALLAGDEIANRPSGVQAIDGLAK